MRHLVRFVLSQQCPLSDNPLAMRSGSPMDSLTDLKCHSSFLLQRQHQSGLKKDNLLIYILNTLNPIYIYIYILPHHPNTCLICLHLPGLSRNTSECNYMFVERSLGRNSSWKKKYLHASYGIHVVCILACFIDN